MARVAIDPREVVEDSGAPDAGAGIAVGIPAASLPEFPDIADFAAAGSNASGEFRCAECGYGVIVQQVLPPCPMCQGSVWERRDAHFAS
jgi:hypothetical protein